MKAGANLRWVIVGAALTALAACDAVNSRVQQFGELADAVSEQVNRELLGGEPDLLASAPLDARALAGVQQAPTEIPDQTLEDLLQAQSFWVVGSVIAKPRMELDEPVVDPEEFDLEAAQPEDVSMAAPSEIEPLPAPADPAADGTAPGAADSGAAPEATSPTPDSEADLPSVDVAMSPAISQPDPEDLESLEPVAAPEPEPARPQRGVLRRPRDLARVEDAVRLAEDAKEEIRRREIRSTRALERAIRRGGVEIDREALEEARDIAEQAARSTSETAQDIGDEIIRKAQDEAAPIPRQLAVRSKLRTEAALAARERAYRRMEQLGVSGVVSPEEGGAMRITLDVKPLRFDQQADPTRIETMRDLFARARDPARRTCSADVSRADIQNDPVLATECVVQALAETGDYEYVEKDFVFSHQLFKKPKPKAATLLPNDPLFGLQWHLQSMGTGAGQSEGGAGFRDFWNRARMTGSKGVTVAVIDTGIQINHPDIKNSPNLAAGFDMVSDPMMGNDGDGRDPNPDDPGDKCDPNDPNSSDTFHGTHVAGSVGVASTNNSSGVAGGAWNVTIVPVRALGRCGGRLSDINDAIRWAAGKVPGRNAAGQEIWNQNPADIINMSIGLFEPCPASMQAAIDDAVATGAIVVVAAGNARVDTKYFAPASCRNVITVAAGDARGVLTPYSNFGAEVSVMAPGGDLTRDDDKDGRPDGILSTKFARDCYDPAKPDVAVPECYYAYENGTSMAAPQVTAALALLKAKFPKAVPSELKARLLKATTSRTPQQCSGKCSQYPGSIPIEGQEGMCYRPCGSASLNLANAALQ